MTTRRRRWYTPAQIVWNHYGGMKTEEATRLKELEDENKGLKQIVADQALSVQVLKHTSEENSR